MLSKILNAHMYLINATWLVQLFWVLFQAYSDILEHYSRAYSHIFRTLCILAYSVPWHIPITKYIQTSRYIDNTILNIFLRSSIRMLIRLRLIQPYLFWLKHIQNPSLIRIILFCLEPQPI